MKKNVQRMFLFVLLLMTFAAEGAMAQFSTGNVVHFKNRASGKAMAATSSNGVAGVTPDKSDYLQLWYVETGGTTVVLRNLGNGRYLQGNSDSSTQWQTVTSKGSYSSSNDTNGDGVKDKFTTSLLLCSNDSYFTLAAETTSWLDYDYDKLHYESLTGKCVSWLGGSEVSQNTWDILPASWWTVETVDGINVNDRWNQIDNFNNIVSKQSDYQGYLNTLFADVLCTQLKPAYDTQAELTASSAYQNLPAELKELALKVCNNDWSEKNRNNQEVTWSSEAGKRFRVQSYEPHSVAEEISSVVKTSSYSNMNNPTGIYADNMEVLYVIVGSNPANGASLSITSLADDSEDYLTSLSATSKTTLTQGLNIIPVYGKGSLQYILYAVNSQSASFPLTNFPDIQINIAGGSINGLYELGKDSGIYTELKTNAEKNGRTYYDVLSNRFAFRTSVATVFKGGSDNSLQRALKMWDKVMLSQHYLMGVKAGRYEEDPLGLHTQSIDYSKQFNNRLLVHSKASIGAYTQMPFRIQFAHGESYLVGDAMETTNQIWVPAHETGHTNQLLINMIGTTEITNNLFSNVAMFYQDYLKTRGGTIADNNAEHLKGTAWHFRDANNRMRMFYQLWLYYHAAGRNKNFFPELYRLLRNDPMSYHDTYGNSNTNYTSTEALKFYKYACQAAGEDLTPFFEAWGFFIPFGQTTITDYYDYKITSTQEHINAAKNEVAGYGYAKNHAILFVEDRVGDVKSAGGVLKQWSQEELAVGDRGQYTDYQTGSDPDGEYTWTISQGNRVIVFSKSGKGAGYVISDNSGNIIAFANSDNFEVTEAIANGLKSGSYKLTVYGTTVGQSRQAINVENSSSPEAQKIALGVLLENIKAVLDITDATNSKIGYYKSSYATGLQNAYTKAKTVYENPTSNATDYLTQIHKLNIEYDLLMEKGDYVKVGVVNGSAYKLQNSAKFEDANQSPVELSMAVAGNDVDGVKTSNVDTQRWIFEATGTEGYYYIKNKSKQTYVGAMTQNSVQVTAKETTTATAGKYRVVVKAPGLVALVDENDRALHVDASFNVVGWNDEAQSSQWYMTAVELNDLGLEKEELDALIGETTWAMNEMVYNVNISNSQLGSIKSEYASVQVDGVAMSINEVWEALYAVQDAQYVSNSTSSTAVQYASAYEELLIHYYYLMGYYNTKNGVSFAAEQAALQAAINEVQAYLNGMSSTGEEKVTLSTTPGAAGYISTNADHNSYCSSGKKDGKGVGALIDAEGTSTYFHSQWESATEGNKVNELHYIQVDLGSSNAVSKFKFNYSTRGDNSGHPYPTKIIVYGSEDGTTFDLELATLTGLVTGAGTTYNSEEIDCGGKYCKSLRFTVATSFGGAVTPLYTYVYCFAMSDFGLTRITESSVTDTWVSADLLASAQADINNAQTVLTNAKTAIELVRETEAMEALLAELKSTQQMSLPVKLSTSHSSPYLYQVETKEVNSVSGPVWQYDTSATTYTNYAAERNYISNATADVANTNQFFYFMKGTETGQVYVYPYDGGQKLLAVDETMYGLGTNARIYSYAKDDVSNYVQEWTFADCGDGYFNMRPVADGTGYYVAMAAQLAGTYKLGFKNNGSDANTKFRFNAVKLGASEDWNTLNNYVNANPEVPGSTQLFATSVASANAYNTLRREAVALLETSAADDVLTEMYNNLVAAHDAITANKPSADKLYYIRSASSDVSYKDVYVYNAGSYLKWTDTAADDNSAVWVIIPQDGNQYTIRSYSDDTKYWKNYDFYTIEGKSDCAETETSADKLNIELISNTNGQVNIYYNGSGYPAYNVAAGNNMVQTNNTKGTAGNTAAFYIEELPSDELSDLKSYQLSMTQWGYAGLFLDFATQLPESMDAYVITEEEFDNVEVEGSTTTATVVLRKLDCPNRVLPANTGVILKATVDIPEGSTMRHTFKPKDVAFGGTEALITANKLKGSAEEVYIPNSTDKTSYLNYNNLDFYLFGVKNGKVGLYKAIEKYKSNGTVDSFWKEDDDVNDRKYLYYIKCSANKIYYQTAQGALRSASGSSRLKFRFAGPDEEFVTDIENVETELIQDQQPEAVYDLQGRRVERIVAPGLYIVNGKKRYVKAAKF